MIDQMLIINSAGLPLYNWEPEGKHAEGSMLSGFLTAMDTFAKGERGEQIRKITLDPTTFIFERAQDLVFVILTTDPEFEPLINRILQEFKKNFLNQFAEEASTFAGNLSIFEPFNTVVEQILTNYGYFDYVRLKNSFETDETLKCIMFLEKQTGEILYIKAKEYLDRNALSFQTNILLKAVDRVISSILNEKAMISIVVSQKARCLLFKATEKLVIIQEKFHPSLLTIADVKINEKRIKNFLKKPEKLMFETKEKFLFFDQMGKDIISNDRIGQFKGDNLPPDCITLVSTSTNILDQIYRDNLFTIHIFTENKLYVTFPLTNYYTFMQIPKEDFPNFEPFFEKLWNCDGLCTEDMLNFEQTIQLIIAFKSKFT